MSKPTILALTPGHPGQIKAMEQHFNIIKLWRERMPEQAIRDHAKDIQALTTFIAPVRRPLIEALPNLEIVAVGAVGVDHIDYDALAERQIALTNTPDVLTAETADTAMALMLSLVRRVVEADMYVRVGRWAGGEEFPLSTSLTGKRLGIVGLGRIGQALAKRAAAFEMDIAYFGPEEKDDMPYAYYNDLKDLAHKSDILVLTCSGGNKTRHLVDYSILSALGPSGFLVNVSRGSVVQEDDLLAALANKDIAGAALDVYASEPHVPEGLLKMDNVVLTPHIGSATRETRTAMGALVVKNLLAHFDGNPLLTPVEF